MDDSVARLIQLMDRVLRMIEHDQAPEQANVKELRKLVDELKGETKDEMSEVPLSR